MSSAIIYKINKKDFLLHANRIAVSGFSLASDPFIRILETEASSSTIVSAIKKVLCVNDDVRVPDPQNWSEFSKEFFKKSGLKSSKVLHEGANLCCLIRKENASIIFTPTEHTNKPDEGFSHKRKEEEITVSYASSDKEIFQAFELALSRCE